MLRNSWDCSFKPTKIIKKILQTKLHAEFNHTACNFHLVFEGKKDNKILKLGIRIRVKIMRIRKPAQTYDKYYSRV
jgi:hypothetical protein